MPRLAGGKRIGKDGLLARLQAAAARSLQNAKNDQSRQIGREPAQETNSR